MAKAVPGKDDPFFKGHIDKIIVDHAAADLLTNAGNIAPFHPAENKDGGNSKSSGLPPVSFAQLRF